MFDFQNLEVYKKSTSFPICYKQILNTTTLECYVKDQLGRASFSIVLNLAEGSAKATKADRKNYFTVVRESVFECVGVLDILKIEGRLSEEQYQNNLELADEISRMLYVMIKNLSI